jgi:hypothetical protein
MGKKAFSDDLEVYNYSAGMKFEVPQFEGRRYGTPKRFFEKVVEATLNLKWELRPSASNLLDDFKSFRIDLLESLASQANLAPPSSGSSIEGASSATRSGADDRDIIYISDGDDDDEEMTSPPLSQDVRQDATRTAIALTPTKKIIQKPRKRPIISPVRGLNPGEMLRCDLCLLAKKKVPS